MNSEELYKEWMSQFDAKNPPRMRDAFMAGMEAMAKTERCNAISLMHYLDEHKAKGKMCLSNMECADLESAFGSNDWAKVIRYIEKYREPAKPQWHDLRKDPTDLPHVVNSYSSELFFVVNNEVKKGRYQEFIYTGQNADMYGTLCRYFCNKFLIDAKDVTAWMPILVPEWKGGEQ